MPFSEDDFRNALRRKDPGVEFTRRVMERVTQRDMRRPAPTPKDRTRFAWLAGLWLRPAPAIATLLVILLAGGWIGYQSYRGHQWEAQLRKQQQERAEERARQETILALRITSEKLNHVFQKVNGALPTVEKIRRERL
jgi:hypothetical protein